MGTVAPERLLAMLRASGTERETASQELRDLLVRAALAYLARQPYSVEAFGADTYESVAEDVAHDALAIILRQLDTFRGDSRFTTWAYRIVVNLMADDVRRRTWRRHPLEADGAARYETPGPGVETAAERQALRDVIRQIIDHELTARQRQALVGRFFDEKPLVVLAAELQTDKDNVYKLIHDARKHLKRALRERGLTAAQVLASFQGTGQ